MARPLGEIQELSLARAPTPNRGPILDERSELDYKLLKNAADGDILRWIVDAASGTGKWTASSGDEIEAVGQLTSDQTISATTAAGAASVISLGAVTYRAAEVVFEFTCSRVSVPAASGGNTLFFQLFEGSTRKGYVAVVNNSEGAGGTEANYPVYGRILVTPAEGEETYSIRAHRSNANCTVFAGSGADDDVAALLTARYTGR